MQPVGVSAIMTNLKRLDVGWCVVINDWWIDLERARTLR